VDEYTDLAPVDYIRISRIWINPVPIVKKCHHCKVFGLTNIKQLALSQEYEYLQHYLQAGEDRGLYSANKRQADRFYKVVKKGKKYPLSIRNDHCGERGQRKTQGLFICPHRNTEDNADRNAAFNIAKWGLGYMSKLGVAVSVNLPRTIARVHRNPMMTMEATEIVR
jgi:hypothetical protein